MGSDMRRKEKGPGYFSDRESNSSTGFSARDAIQPSQVEGELFGRLAATGSVLDPAPRRMSQDACEKPWGLALISWLSSVQPMPKAILLGGGSPPASHLSRVI